MGIHTTALAAGLIALAITSSVAPASAEESSGPEYIAQIVDQSVVTRLNFATFMMEPDHGTVDIRSLDAHLITALLLSFTVNGTAHHLAADITDSGHTLTLRPKAEPAPVAAAMENQLALDEFAGDMLRGPAIGTIVGTVLGAMVGAVIGFGSCLVVGPGCLATTPAAIAAFAAGGGIAGTLLGGGAGLVDGLWKYISTVQAPPGQSGYSQRPGVSAGIPDANLRLPSGSANGLKTGSSGGASSSR
ncbi:hypothetical protein [Nocardia aobensis]|uniref:hypothetical protein n=1 Tax=Nocardia aobensis TaxID=257277 RepID=UPI0012F63C4E|nr:hypothetical protein [Nocardia aobensis]